MQKVPIDLLQPGMVLAKPVTNENGMPLCAEGTELSANLIERLKKMDIPFVTLKGRPVDMGQEEKSKEEKLHDVSKRFLHVDGDPIMDKLKKAIEYAIMAEEEESVSNTTIPIQGDQQNGNK